MNFGAEQGLSGRRDTSTYSPWLSYHQGYGYGGGRSRYYRRRNR